jgi:excisionase family DNA binding protein
MAKQWHQYSKEEQSDARDLRDRGFAVGINESVSQIIKDLDGWEQRIRTAERTAEAAKQWEEQPTEAALLAERERLLARVAEIDALLPPPPATEVTTRQAAQALGVSIRTVQRWAAQGKVQASKTVQGHWVITITITASKEES